MRLFITGVSGLLGLNMALQLRDRADVSGCYLNNPVRIDGVETTRLDLTEADRTEETLRSVDPDLIVHAAGLTSVDACERDPERAHLLNTEVSRYVAEVAAKIDAKLVHISTDHLTDGASRFQHEDDEPEPLNAYARSKLEAEQLVQEVAPDALVVRTNFYGWGPPHRASFSDWILDGLQEGTTLTMFEDVYFSPILVNDLIDAMMDLVDLDASGVYNVAGSERISKHDFALQIADVFGLDPGPIKPVTLEEGNLLAPRPLENALDCSRVEAALDRPMPTTRQGLEALRARGEDGWPDAVIAAAEPEPATQR